MANQTAKKVLPPSFGKPKNEMAEVREKMMGVPDVNVKAAKMAHMKGMKKAK